MAPPQLIALNKLGEIRNQDPTLYQVIQEVQNQVNEYILAQAALPPTPAAPASLAGDVTGPLGATVVGALQGRSVLSTAPSFGQALYWDGAAWAPSLPTVKYKAHVYQGSSATIANTTFTKIVLDTITFDPNGNFDAVTNYRWTCPVTGYYHVHGKIALVMTATGNVALAAIYLNGANASQAFGIAGNSGGVFVAEASVNDIMFLTATNYLELWVWQSSGFNATTSAGNLYTNFSVHFLSQ